MRKSIKELLTGYPVRKSKQQKLAFSHWVEAHLEGFGYKLERHAYSKKGTNLLVGNVETAEVILTPHYDTPPNFYAPLYTGVGGVLTLLINQIFPIMLIILYYLKDIHSKRDTTFDEENIKLLSLAMINFIASSDLDSS